MRGRRSEALLSYFPNSNDSGDRGGAHGGVLSFPLLSAELCQKAWEELHAYEAAAASNTELPLHVRHDGNLGSLETLGFLPLLKSIERAVAPVLAARLPAFGRCEVHPAFP